MRPMEATKPDAATSYVKTTTARVKGHVDRRFPCYPKRGWATRNALPARSPQRRPSWVAARGVEHTCAARPVPPPQSRREGLRRSPSQLARHARVPLRRNNARIPAPLPHHPEIPAVLRQTGEVSCCNPIGQSSGSSWDLCGVCGSSEAFALREQRS